MSTRLPTKRGSTPGVATRVNVIPTSSAISRASCRPMRTTVTPPPGMAPGLAFMALTAAGPPIALTVWRLSQPSPASVTLHRARRLPRLN